MAWGEWMRRGGGKRAVTVVVYHENDEDEAVVRQVDAVHAKLLASGASIMNC
jgi:hypothetical protein